jgi:hypothetical protein
MLQLIFVIAAIAVAIAYVVRSLARSARGEDCRCGTAACTLKDHHPDGGSLPCQNASPAVSAESLAESARNLGKHPASNADSPVR